MTLAASVLGFDIIELWSHAGDLSNDEDFHCTYVHATPEIIATFPDIIVGYWPEHKRKHTISPNLCRYALESKSGYYWHTLIEGEDGIDCLRSNAQTEVAYLLQGKEFPFHVFIVGFSVNKIEFLHSKIKFLSGIGYAIYVTAFVETNDGEDTISGTELDVPEKQEPRRNMSRNVIAEEHEKEESVDVVPMEVIESYESMNKTDYMTVNNIDEFAFPIHNLPLAPGIPIKDLHIEHVKEITHFADGSNSNIYSGRYFEKTVVVKMVKKGAAHDSMALHEFDTEQEILSRIAHPNVVAFVGGGCIPRRFIVLEWLGGGTLSALMNRNQNSKGTSQGLFRQPTFTYSEILSRAKEIADALDYLHTRIHPDLTVIHRDLKPDNVAFTTSGVLKLIDMGLSTCVRRRSGTHVAYEMTGNTGSLRYMAPEVALRKPYTEKVDVYSFGILLWQMATDAVPFKGMSRNEFMKEVVIGKTRPKLDSSWPVGFCNLLTTCWHHESIARPPCSTIVSDLTFLIEELDGHALSRRGKSIRRTAGGLISESVDMEDPQSSWF